MGLHGKRDTITDGAEPGHCDRELFTAPPRWASLQERPQESDWSLSSPLVPEQVNTIQRAPAGLYGLTIGNGG